jgi:hypothetical protein
MMVRPIARRIDWRKVSYKKGEANLAERLTRDGRSQAKRQRMYSSHRCQRGISTGGRPDRSHARWSGSLSAGVPKCHRCSSSGTRTIEGMS